MYIDSLALTNIRTFKKASVQFVHPDRQFGVEAELSKDGLPKPRLPNVNLLLGDNGSGKTTLLRAIAMSAFGPAIVDSRLYVPNIVRNVGDGEAKGKATISAGITLHKQDAEGPSRTGKAIKSEISIQARGEIERTEFTGVVGPEWEAVYESRNDRFFVVGYGPTRRVERAENVDMGARANTRFARVQRVQGLFDDSFSMIPMSFWLPKLAFENPGRYRQVVNLINRLLGPGHYSFTGEVNERNEYFYEREGARIPFYDLSDGYRAFLGWVGDLLYHVCFGCPSGKKLVENSGVVLVDEIDLHLHPKWQMGVVRRIAEVLPRIQFILTSHSPLVAGSLEWMNVIALKLGKKLTTSAKRIPESIYGLDADQMLLTEFFGLSTTRSATKEKELNRLSMLARHGDKKAAIALLKAMSRGVEEGR